ncbi:response regulator [Endozoicomonas sp. Mp262]|uniref:response regulator n=1 Tax=Endozoicomonas sp. Mp262 TaxID=2919499 RepID=UPI0021D8EFB7
MTDSNASSGFGLHILVAEDNPVNQLVAEKLLKKLGCTCVIANNGREAIGMLASGTYDLILMDVMMPELDGMSATREIRAVKNETTDIPIVAFTANAMKSDQEACYAAGMNDFISKPVTVDRMREMLAKWTAIIKGEKAG